MADAVKVMRGLEELYPEIRFIERLRHCIEHFPQENWEDALSRGQINSKQWLVHQLILNGRADIGKAIVCGGWVGTLSRLFFDNPQIKTKGITSIDNDVGANVAAGELNREYIVDNRFVARCADMLYVDYSEYDTVINTSCEHLEDWDFWWHRIPSGKLVVLQSNDFMEPEDHVWTMADEDDFADNIGPLSKLIFKGTLPTIKYNRFMVIGIK